MQEDINSLNGNPYQLIKNYVLKSFTALLNIETTKKNSPVKEYYDKFEKNLKRHYTLKHIK